MTVDGALGRSAPRRWDRDAKIEFVSREDPRALELIRHDAAHVLAQAVQELFPGTQVTFGPVMEDGFYYDFARDEPFSTEDFPKIEKRMKEIVDADLPIIRKVWDKDDGDRALQIDRRNYKAETIDEVIKPGEPSRVYSHGDMGRSLPRAASASTGKSAKPSS